MEVRQRYTKSPRSAPVVLRQDRDDHAVWDEFRKGSELAFTAIYKRYATDLYHYGERLTGNKQLIEDSLHDLFVELWRQRNHYEPVKHLKFYLLKSFRHRLLKNIRRNRRFAGLPVDENPHNIDVCFSVDIEWPDALDTEERRRLILKTINGLSGREKQAVFLRFYDELTYEEIASLMEISTRSTYKLMYRALDALRKTMAALTW